MNSTIKYRYVLVDLTKNERHVFTDIPMVARYLRTSAYDVAVKLRRILMFDKAVNPSCLIELRNNVVLYYNSVGVPTDGAILHKDFQDIYCLDLVTRTLHCFDNIDQAEYITLVKQTSILNTLENEELRPIGKYFFSYHKDKLADLPLITEEEALSNFENNDEPHILIFGSEVGSIESHESPITDIIMSEYDRSFEYMTPWKPGIVGHPVFQTLKETTHMFKNMREQICFILEYTSGETRATLLAVTEEIYEDKAAADQWLWFFKEIWIPPKWMDTVTKMHKLMTEAEEETNHDN